MTTDLPPLLMFDDGAAVRTPEDWARRRRALEGAIVPLQYGGLPPEPTRVTAELLSDFSVKRLGGARHSTWRVVCSFGASTLAFGVHLWVPAEGGPCPVIIDGDGCWDYVTDEVKADVLRRGNALSLWNRCEIAADPLGARDVGLYGAVPGATFGALSAWAWGYHRVVDFLVTQEAIDAQKIAVTGHSRGGKAALLAGATDARIALTNPNNSGCGGAGCYRHQGPNSERLADILHRFPRWFGPGLPRYVGREGELPFDQHFLKALVAPRDLLTTEALGDAWANPAGTFTTHAAARAAYDLLGASDRIGVLYREGVHAHQLDDWITLLDYMDHRFRGVAGPRRFDIQALNQRPPE